MEPRISIITLGVEDLDRAVKFYEAMGLERHKRFSEGVAFFQMGGVILALWPREDLARDAGKTFRAAGNVEKRGSGYIATTHSDFSGVALAYNTRTETEVIEVLERVKEIGGRVVKPAQRAFWGGMQGYFEDTEGNLWEVAHNPDFPIDEEGRITLPQ